MFERFIDKSSEPSIKQIEDHLGRDSYKRLLTLEKHLETHYSLTKELRFPFGNSYGWGNKYGHKSSHLCYVFFEKEAFTVTLQIGDKQVPLLEEELQGLSQRGQELWANRYPCGENGGWVHYRVFRDEDLKDVYQFIYAKKKPMSPK